MDNEALLRAEMRAMVDATSVPPVSLDAIHRKMLAPAIPRPMRLSQYAALAAALLLVVVPLTSRSVVPTLQQKINELLHWSPPPPVSAQLKDGMQPAVVSLEDAQAKVKFTVVAPTGLPADVATSKITLTPTAVYGPATHGWTAGENSIEFSYTRSGNRSFRIEASTFNAKEPTRSKYMFEADEVDAKGLPRRYERFYWHNGNQEMSVVAEGISAAEIAAIRDAMHGEPIATVWPPKHAGHSFFMKIGKP